MRSITMLACTFLFLIATGCGCTPRNSPIILTPEEKAKLEGGIEKVDNPQFLNWGKFPVGTSFKRKITTDSAKSVGMTVTTFTFKLMSKTEEEIVVESEATTVYHDNRVEKNPPVIDRHSRLVSLPDGADKATWGKLKDGTDEEITVLGKKYKAKKSISNGNTDAGKFVQQVWSSDEIPGGLLKSITVVAAAEETTTIEIVELVIPKSN